MPGARWFPEARLNFAENLLRSRDDSDALVFWGEDRVKNRLSHGDLYRQVAHFAAALLEMGVEPGDRVAAWMPNLPETIVVMLAATSIGRSSRRRRRISACRACSTASARSSPRCWWRSMATTTTARSSIAWSASPPSPTACPR
jgi:hypothetical protein